jgi:hypothetical protein
MYPRNTRRDLNMLMHESPYEDVGNCPAEADNSKSSFENKRPSMTIQIESWFMAVRLLAASIMYVARYDSQIIIH